MNTLTYKGDIGRINPDLDDGILLVRVINTRNIIGFHGETSDSGIIGSKECVSKNYQRFKQRFCSKHEKKPKPIKGLEIII